MDILSWTIQFTLFLFIYGFIGLTTIEACKLAFYHNRVDENKKFTTSKDKVRQYTDYII